VPALKSRLTCRRADVCSALAIDAALLLALVHFPM
jgi:hypothetical protein